MTEAFPFAHDTPANCYPVLPDPAYVPRTYTLVFPATAAPQPKGKTTAPLGAPCDVLKRTANSGVTDVHDSSGAFAGCSVTNGTIASRIIMSALFSWSQKPGSTSIIVYFSPDGIHVWTVKSDGNGPITILTQWGDGTWGDSTTQNVRSVRYAGTARLYTDGYSTVASDPFDFAVNALTVQICPNGVCQ